MKYIVDTGMHCYRIEADSDEDIVAEFPWAMIEREDGTEIDESLFLGLEAQ